MVTNKQVYRVLQRYGLLQKKRVREAALYQAARLFELLPQAQNELWQAAVTYLHLPGHSWWYAVTVIDYTARPRVHRSLFTGFSGQSPPSGETP